MQKYNSLLTRKSSEPNDRKLEGEQIREGGGRCAERAAVASIQGVQGVAGHQGQRPHIDALREEVAAAEGGRTRVGRLPRREGCRGERSAAEEHRRESSAARRRGYRQGC
jgi:hypothetical protein